MVDESDKKDKFDPLEPIDPSKPRKSLEQLVEEGTISEKQFRSMLFMMQAGFGGSSSREDAIYIQKKIEELNNEIDIIN